jgi:hypothetical protein
MALILLYQSNRKHFNSAGINCVLVNGVADAAAARAAVAAKLPYGDVDPSGWAALNLGGLEATAIASVAAGGAGYAEGDEITLTGGTATSQALLEVTAVAAGAVTAAKILRPGKYTVAPANPVAQGATDGGGTGATFNMTFSNAVIAALPASRTMIWIEGTPASLLGVTRGGKPLPVE